MKRMSPVNAFIIESKMKHPVVEKLENKRIVEFEDGGSDGIYVTECCDNWFYCSLSAEEVLQLAEFLKGLAGVMGAQEATMSVKPERNT